MKVCYCRHCRKYYLNANRRLKHCKACGDSLIILPIDFMEFTDKSEKEREEYIAGLCLT